MNGLLDGRVALVTGAAGGIGTAIIERFAGEGALVAVNDIDEEAAVRAAKALEDSGARAMAVPGDVSHAGQVTRMIDEIERGLGGLDILVNNAGVEHRASLADHNRAAWDEVLTVNLTGPFSLSQAALPLLAAGHGGAIVNICSVAIIGFFGQAAYDASKGGLLTLTRSLAAELGRRRIRANAVCPGFIETPMIRASELHHIGEKQVRTLPIARFGRPDEVAAAVAWLASSQASYVTGQCLFVDGGWVRW